MKYCQECGSEITENGMFCPFCGITLQSFQFSEDESVQEKTIAVNQAEWADLVGGKIEPLTKDFPTKKNVPLPEKEKDFSERQEAQAKQNQTPDAAAGSLPLKTSPVDDPALLVPDTDDYSEMTFGKELAGNEPDTSPDPVLKAFDEKAEASLKSQIELQRMIFVQNQKIIELLEQLLKKQS